MLKRVAKIALLAGGLVVLVMALAMGWLKIHEDQIVFAAARGRQHMLAVLPADAQRLTVPEPTGAGLAALVYRTSPDADTGFWVLHLHGNADTAFSPWQVRHCEALRGAGFNVLEIDYRGFGPTPGKPSETAMYEDSEAAYQELLRRGIAPNRIILLGHSLGSGPAVLLATRHDVAALVVFGAFTSIPDAAAYRYPYLPVRWVVGVHFNSLARIGGVHVPVVIAHSRTDTLIPYAHALKLFAAANEPKRLLTLDSVTNDGFGGHVDALYEHMDILRATLAELVPALRQPPAP
ncbi:MAG: alpha/beta hydrolase [Steroidobacteraceae bacterium]